ncbi:MAG: NAD(P)-dependent oxidoreductase [Anaerolineales bacterium]
MMTRYRILNLEPENYSPEALAILQSLGEVEAGPLDRAALLERIGEFEVLIVRLAHQIDRQVLERAGRLKVIVSATTGLDHIDLECAAGRGITVLSLRGETDFLRRIPATAEHTWALLLALVRRVPAAHASVLAGEWQRDRFRGSDLAGKSLGLLGLGRIGEKVARYGLAFGMQVLAYDPYRADWPGEVERLSSQADLLVRSQVFSIHVPLNAETENLIGAAELALLPPGALLINTARGQVLDEAALLAALESGRLGGAALDVLCDERRASLVESPLVRYARRHDNLILTPHIGGATRESMAATERFMAHKLRAYLEGLSIPS